jgi:hypothetical protein
MERKEERHHDAMGRHKKITAYKHRDTNTQPTHISYAQAAQSNQDARRAAARRHTPRPPRHAAPNIATHKATGKQPEHNTA